MTRSEILDILSGPPSEGERPVLFLTGEAGMGKTTLLTHARSRVNDVWSMAMVECSSPVAGIDVGAIEALHPWVTMIRTLSSNSASPSAKLVADLALTWIKFVPIVGDLIESTVNTVNIVQRHRSSGRETVVSREHVVEQCLAFFRAASQNVPLLLVLDDAHWADDSSLNLLFALARERCAGIRIVVAFREQDARTADHGAEHPILRIKRELERYELSHTLALPPITPDEARLIIRSEQDRAPSEVTDEEIDSALSFSGGNPLMLRGWVHGGLSTTSIQSVIQERLRRLDRDIRDMLRYASAEGELFSSTTVQRLTGSSPLQIASLLRRAASEFDVVTLLGKLRLYATETSVYRFTSDALRMALEMELTDEERVLLHEALAEVLRSELSIAVNNALPASGIRVRLAAHERAACRWESAARTLIEHARELWSLFAVTEVRDVLELANDMIAQSMEGPDRERLTAELNDLQAEIALFEHRIDDAELYNANAHELFMSLGERTRACDVLFRIAATANHRGDPARVLEVSHALESTALECGYEDGLRAALSMRAHYLESVGRYDDAATLLAELEQRCAGDRSRQRAAVLVNQARLLTIKGLDEETLEPLQEAISILDELKRWDALARALNNRGIALANLGRHCEAQSTYERALEIHEQIGDAVGASSLRTNLGQIKMEDGRIDEALALFEQSISLKRTANDRYGLSIALYSRAIARRQLGDETACDRDLREALEIAEAIGERSIIDEVKRLMQS